MAAEYRAPKAVQEEAANNTGDISLRIASPLSIEDVANIRASWIGQNGISWANKITAEITSRADLLTKGEGMTTRDDSIDLESIGRQAIYDELCSADMSLSNAFDCIIDAGSSIWSLQSKFMPEDEMPAVLEMNSATAVIDRFVRNREARIKTGELSSTRSEEESLMVEERKTMIAKAERLTMETEIRSVSTEDGSLKIEGYAAIFNAEAEGLPFREQIAPGAFKRYLASGEPTFLLVNHDTSGIPLASTASGTLVLTEDARGLFMSADLDPANPKAQELYSALSRGDMNKMSFSFTVAPDGDRRSNGLRTLLDINVPEISTVIWAAYELTDVNARSAADAETEALELRRRGLQLKARLLTLKK